MAFCSNCGSQVQGRFCARCGAPVASGGPAAPPSQPPPGDASASGPASQPPPAYSYSAPPPAPPVSQSAGMDENVASALCYVLGLLSGVLFLVLEPYNRNRLVRFHAFQSIFLNIAWIVVFIGLSIISIVLLPIPFLGAILSVMLHLAAALGALILWLMLMYKAYNKERWVLPVIGPMAEKQA